MSEAYERLRTRLGEIADIRAAANLLSWDQETYMPDGAGRNRAHQLSTLRRIEHDLFTAEETGALLDRAQSEMNGAPDDVAEALLRVTRRDYDRERKLPATLVAALAETGALAQQAWKKARTADDFSVFAPLLEKLVDLSGQKAEAIGYDEHVYDALLDEFEPEMPTSTVKKVFEDLRTELVPIVQHITERPAPDDAFLRKAYDRDRQWDFSIEVLRDLGYSFDHGRQDISAHPFTTSFSLTDVRITTRVLEDFFPTAFFFVPVLAVAARQQPAMDARVQRLHPPVHHLGVPRHLRHAPDLQPRLPQRPRGTAGRDQLPPQVAEARREVGQPRLVGYAQNRSRHR